MKNAEIRESLQGLVNERLRQLGVFLSDERKRGLDSLTIPEQVRLMEALANSTQLSATKCLVTAITRAKFNRQEQDSDYVIVN